MKRGFFLRGIAALPLAATARLSTAPVAATGILRYSNYLGATPLTQESLQQAFLLFAMLADERPSGTELRPPWPSLRAVPHTRPLA